MEIKNNFLNANEVFEYFYEVIKNTGVDYQDTKALFNIGFNIENPLDNKITHRLRNWKHDYATAEWQWYLSGNPSIDHLGKIYGFIPEIWHKMADSKNNVRSNYGWQWQREDQLERVINMLIKNPNTRQAAISIYDGKEIPTYFNDTPCTYAIHFTILHNKLNMSVMMRSNDLWFGFCNDQYCFSKLQQLVAMRVGIEVGTYYHFVNNLHLYNRNIN